MEQINSDPVKLGLRNLTPSMPNAVIYRPVVIALLSEDKRSRKEHLLIFVDFRRYKSHASGMSVDLNMELVYTIRKKNLEQVQSDSRLPKYVSEF